MKFFFCLFERPFEIQKNGIFLFEISFFISEILTFFYYANQFSEDVIWCAIIKAVSLTLGTTNVHHKRNKMTPLVLLPQQLFQLQSLSVIKKNKCETKGRAWNKHSSHIVLIPIIVLAVVDGAGLRQKLGISVFIETAPGLRQKLGISVFIETAPATKLLSW